jgi:uncharacterized repeat protein (TIGR03987 family)
MPQQLILPATIMSLAFVFYTTGVWWERLERRLRGRHVALFWLGIVCDGTATYLMRQLVIAGEDPGFIHSVTGLAAFLLMLLHALWATWVLAKGSAEARAGFHRYSVAVWAMRLVPYVGGMVAGMMRGAAG